MASEVVCFLLDKFLEEFRDADESDLMDFLKLFKDIYDNLEKAKEEICSFASHETVELCYSLHDALADCRIFSLQRNALSKNLRPLSFIKKELFISKIKQRLSDMGPKFLNSIGGEPRPFLLPMARWTPSGGCFSEIIGYGEYLKQIEGLLFRDRVSAIGIVGMGGSGKTTLAQKVFNSDVACETFWPRIWVSLSDVPIGGGDFGVRLVKYLMEEMDHDLNELLGDHGFPELLRLLMSLLSDKRYLIVFDDAWKMDESLMVLSQQLQKSSGGAVFVTSRLEKVAAGMVGKENVFGLMPTLSKDDCWKIFESTVKKESVVWHGHPTLSKLQKEVKDRCYGLPLAAKTLAEIIPKQITEFESNNFLREFYIPDYLLLPRSDIDANAELPGHPVLVFIDMKMGGELAKNLLVIFRQHLNRKQVFNLLEENPEKVLQDIYKTLGRPNLKDVVNQIQNRLKIIVVGGDAASNWLLGVISDLRLSLPPPIASIAQGTENTISYSSGWGRQGLNADRESITRLLNDVKDAEEIRIDSWHIFIKTKATPNSVADEEIPRALHQFRPSTQPEDDGGFRGGFWNYFSVGIDSTRFSGPLCFRAARTLSMLLNVKIMRQDGDWEACDIPSRMRSIICLNFPLDNGVQKSYIDDGLLEVIGFRDVFVPQSKRGTLLAQAKKLRFEFDEGAAETVNMSIDGSPWGKIPLDGISCVEVSHFGCVSLLVGPSGGYLWKQPSDSGALRGNSTDQLLGETSEAQRKFGAAATFKRVLTL